MFESLEQRQLMSTDHPLGVALNSTALSTVNNYLPTTEAQIKNLGIDSVRVFQGIPAGATSIPAGTNGNLDHLIDLYSALGPSSDYASHKFSILMTITPSSNATPVTDGNLQSYIASLLSYHKSGGSVTIADIVSRYEIGNEINTQGFYNYNSSDTSSTSTARLDNYIQHFLTPAATKLNALDPTAELSAGSILAYSGNTAAMLQYLLGHTPQSTLGLLTYAGYHPYGIDANTPLSSGSGGVLALNGKANEYLSAYNGVSGNHPLQLIATEWGTNQTSDAAWAAQLNQSFTGSTATQSGFVANSMRDTYATAYYYPFAYASDTSTQPHGGQALVTLGSSGTEPARADFYNTYTAWSSSKITGQLTGSDVGSRTVYVDVDHNGTYNSAVDVAATTSASGAYEIDYSVGTGSNPFIQGGDYTLAVAPSGTQATFSSQPIHITAASAQTVNFTNGVTPPPTGTISGVYWGDDNANGLKDGTESGQSGKLIYVDLNNNGSFDSGEPNSTTGTGGSYSITGLTLGQTYRVRRSGLPSGYRFTTPVSGYYDVTPTSTTPTVANEDFLTTGTSTAYITGTYYGDDDQDGIFDPGESGQSGKVMYLDANNNGVLDSGELTSTTDGNGVYHFDNLPVSSTTTYHIRRSGLPTGFRLTSPSTGVIDLVLSAAKSYDDNNFGVTYA